MPQTILTIFAHEPKELCFVRSQFQTSIWLEFRVPTTNDVPENSLTFFFETTLQRRAFLEGLKEKITTLLEEDKVDV